jgi:hypothetical protein
MYIRLINEGGGAEGEGHGNYRRLWDRDIKYYFISYNYFPPPIRVRMPLNIFGR